MSTTPRTGIEIERVCTAKLELGNQEFECRLRSDHHGSHICTGEPNWAMYWQDENHEDR